MTTLFHYFLHAHFPAELITIDGHQEFFVDKIVDERRRIRGTQCLILVIWRGGDPEGDNGYQQKNLEAANP